MGVAPGTACGLPGIRPACAGGCAEVMGVAAGALVDGDSKVNCLSGQWQRWLVVSSLVFASVSPLS